MSMDRDVNVRLNVTPDPQLEQKISQTTGGIKKELEKLRRANVFKLLADDAARLTEETGDAEKAAQRLGRQLARLDASEAEVKGATRRFAGGGGAGGGSGGGGGAAAGGVDRGKVGGALGVAGAAGGQLASLGGISGQAGSAIGLLGSSIGALGPIGAVAAVAAIGLGVAVGKLGEASEKARRETELLLESRFAEIDARGESTEALNEQLETLNEEREALQEKQSLAEGVAQSERDGRSALADFGDSISIWSDGVNEAEETAEELTTQLEDTEAKIEGLNSALNSTETAAADAAAALEEQVKANTKSALTNADIAAKTLKFELDAVELSKEANEKRTEQISKQTQVLQKEFDTLTASLTKGGVNTEEVSKRLGVLSGQMNLLNVEAGVLGEALATATSETEKAATGEASTVKKRSSSLRAGFIKIIKEEEGAADERLKIAMDFANAIKDIQFDSDKERQQIAIDANREQSAALRRHAFEIGQDFEQDFLGAFKAQNELAFGLRETQIGAGQSFADVDRSQRQSQQQLRADTPGAQQLIENNQTFNFPGANATLFETILQDSMGVS